MTSLRPARIFTALRTIRGHRPLNDQQTVSRYPLSTRAYTGAIGGDAGLPWCNGNQSVREGCQPAGRPAPAISADGGLRLGIPTPKLAQITQKRLKEILHYNPDTGVFTWLVDKTRVMAGDRAGKVTRDGYVDIGVDGKRYPAHRLAVFYMTGKMPSEYVDHINSDRSDNRWINLRLASNSQNQMNVPMWSNNTSGFKGVSWHKHEGRWRASIRVGGKRKHLGYFDTAEQGRAAYNEAAKIYHGEFARLN